MVQTSSQTKSSTKAAAKAPKTSTTKSASTKGKPTAASLQAPKVITKKAKGDTKKAAHKNTFEGSATQTSQNTHHPLNSPSVNAETRHRMIAELAFSFAEKRNFCSGNDVSDWLTAEAIIDQKLNR